MKLALYSATEARGLNASTGCRQLAPAGRRRAFITLLGGAAAWPLAARAQQSDRMRRMGVLTNLAENDPEARARMEAFQQGLQQLGWTVGQNLQIDTRSTLGDAERTRKYAAEVVALSPDVILAIGTETTAACNRQPAASFDNIISVSSRSRASPAAADRV